MTTALADATLEAWLLIDDCKDVGGHDYVRFLYKLATAGNAKRIGEIGLGWCYSGRTFCLALEANGGGELVSIDPLDGLPLDSHSALQHIEKPPAGVTWTWIPKISHDVDTIGPVDILYIDGDPRFPFDDAMRFYGDIEPGGLLILDGIGSQDGPNIAVDKMKALGLDCEIHQYSEHYSFAVHRKSA